jgi:hypothetical protein
MDFQEILYISITHKFIEKSSFINIWQEYWKLYMTTNIHLWSYLTQFFIEWKAFQTNGVEKSKHRFCVHKCFFGKLCNLWDNVVKYCTVDRSQMTARCIAFIRLQTHTVRIRNTYCFSTATTVAQMCFNVMLHAHCLVFTSMWYINQ